jgi:hypothetical protein
VLTLAEDQTLGALVPPLLQKVRERCGKRLFAEVGGDGGSWRRDKDLGEKLEREQEEERRQQRERERENQRWAEELRTRERRGSDPW